MFCTHCGQQVSDKDNFCARCGTALQSSPAVNTVQVPISAAKNTISPAALTFSEKSLLEQISRLNKKNKDISADLYQQLRDFEMAWLERNYDFNSLPGIESIPVIKNIPRAPAPSGPMQGHTGEVYYYLRYKAYKHDEAGNHALALACMRKSVALVMCRDYFTVDDCYPLVKMLARMGYADDAYSEKRKIDQLFGIRDNDDHMIKAELQRGKELQDFLWLQEIFPDKCPKSISSYRRMKTQNTKNYQLLKQLAADYKRNI